MMCQRTVWMMGYWWTVPVNWMSTGGAWVSAAICTGHSKNRPPTQEQKEKSRLLIAYSVKKKKKAVFSRVLQILTAVCVFVCKYRGNSDQCNFPLKISCSHLPQR